MQREEGNDVTDQEAKFLALGRAYRDLLRGDTEQVIVLAEGLGDLIDACKQLPDAGEWTETMPPVGTYCWTFDAVNTEDGSNICFAKVVQSHPKHPPRIEYHAFDGSWPPDPGVLYWPVPITPPPDPRPEPDAEAAP